MAKRTTKSSKTPAKQGKSGLSVRSIQLFEAKWGRKPDKLDIAFRERNGRWQNYDEFRYWDTFGKFPNKETLAKFKTAKTQRQVSALKAAETRRKNEAKKQARSIAARKGWQTRKSDKPKTIRDWEKQRERDQQKRLREMEKRAPERPATIRALRWYDEVGMFVRDWSEDQLASFVLDLKRRGFKRLRWEREVPVSMIEYSGSKSPSGYIYTSYIWLDHLTESQLIDGSFKYGFPSIASMRSPGVDWAVKLIFDYDDSQKLPKSVATNFRKLTRETRDTIVSDDDWGKYLRTGSKPKRPRKKKST